MIFRCIAPDWLKQESPSLPPVVEGELEETRLEELNALGYNVYSFPNHPSTYSGGNVQGEDVDIFNFVFVDMDLKSGKYSNKEAFVSIVMLEDPLPTFVVDSGNGIHAYWAVEDLDAKSYLYFQRRLCRLFDTDPAVSKICQLMRTPGYNNTKEKGNFKPCQVIRESSVTYTREELDALLAPITPEDRDYCEQHFNKTYNISQITEVSDKIPASFHKLLKENKEVKACYLDPSEDRSGADFRLGHLMFAAGISREDATSVLVNAQKALARAPKHRISYAQGVVDKIWTYEQGVEFDASVSSSIRQILNRTEKKDKHARFPCYQWVDNTERGLRLGQVMGLVAGSGVGKTAVALNMFRGFAANNPEYHHFFVGLEQPDTELAERWVKLCGDDDRLHDKVHIMSNYDEEGHFRALSFDSIREYILNWQKVNKKSVGCVVIDHIGALAKEGHKAGENQDLITICHQMKAFAIETNTFLIMQSQTNRIKAGIGDIELDKDAAFGTVFFESYCDYLVTLWQPLKRAYKEGAPTITSYKFCKIRHKNQKKDTLQEDVKYSLFFDSESGKLRPMTEAEENTFSHWNARANKARERDKKSDIGEYVSVHWSEEDGKVNNDNDTAGATGTTGDATVIPIRSV